MHRRRISPSSRVNRGSPPAGEGAPGPSLTPEGPTSVQILEDAVLPLSLSLAYLYARPGGPAPRDLGEGAWGAR